MNRDFIEWSQTFCIGVLVLDLFARKVGVEAVNWWTRRRRKRE